MNIGAFLAILEKIDKQEETVSESTRKRKHKKAKVKESESKESKRCDGHGRDSRNDREVIL
ncbi:hypothetical protein [Brotaphodocola sp.]|uniref:hypothetical protein n=1 Tax=Brotaphodocola sp. TaxID=3073577 RepID=UPI003D7E0C33